MDELENKVEVACLLADQLGVETAKNMLNDVICIVESEIEREIVDLQEMENKLRHKLREALERL